jgi:hypothetical protein
MAMCNKKFDYKLARYGNFHQQKLAKCTKHNLKYGYGPYILHNFITMHYVGWSYLLVEISQTCIKKTYFIVGWLFTIWVRTRN